jgi:3-deoxy-D-arabino-heptulosonate 7-phosphate (DAHP) synthase class II
VEFFRGIANPMGVKIGPAMTTEWLQGLVTTLNPQNTPGRLTIIHRFGAKDVEKGLPQMIKAVRETGQRVNSQDIKVAPEKARAVRTVIQLKTLKSNART